MKKIVGVLVLALWAAAVPAQVVVNVSGVPKRNFAVTGFTGDASVTALVTDCLKNDLRLSGYFQLTPASGAEFVQEGSVRIERGQGYVDCTVTLQATKKVILSKTYQGSSQDLRRMVHALTDDIIQAIMGQRGIARTKIAFVWSRNKTKELAIMDTTATTPGSSPTTAASASGPAGRRMDARSCTPVIRTDFPTCWKWIGLPGSGAG
jgi:Tol biopolymer transport system component